MAKVAVHIVTWNGANFLQPFFDSIKKQTTKDIVIRILDNGSTDDTQGILKKTCEEIDAELYLLKENYGFAGGHNFLFQKIQEPYVILLNQDLILDENYIAGLLNFLEANELVGGAQGVIERIDSNQIDSAGLKISRWHSVHDIVVSPHNEVAEVFGVSGAAPVYNVEALKKVAYQTNAGSCIFSDKFFSYKEDVDLAMRLRLAGYAAFVVASATAKHARGLKDDGLLSRNDRTKFMNRLSYRNHWLLLLHTAQFKWLSYTGFNVLVYEFIKFFWIILREPSTLAALKQLYLLHADTNSKKKQVAAMTKDINAISKWYA